MNVKTNTQETEAEFMALLDAAHNAGEQATDGMVDTYPCGGAYVIAEGTSELVKLFKKYGTSNGQEGANARYTFNNWTMSKDYPKGFSFSNHNKKQKGGFQNIQMHAAVANAYVQKFGEHNIVTSSRTYID